MRKNMVLRKATLKDIKEIHSMLKFFASKGDLLGRPLITLYEKVREFFICEEKNEIIGCVALAVVWENMAEIRSLAIKENHQKMGIGRKLVNACIDEAKKLDIKKVFTLTYKPEFFEKLDFKSIEKQKLPHKIWTDCINCPQFPDCNENALMLEI